MARVISSVLHADEIGNRGERMVYKALKNSLPNSFLVFYSVPFLREHQDGGNLVDGEGDFVVLDQSRGVVLMLEVKEGSFSTQMDGDRRVWFQSGRECNKSPWTQVAGNKYNLVKWLCGKLECEEKQFPLSHGHALLLPDVHTPIGCPLPHVKDDVAMTWGSGDELANHIETCCERWQQKGRRDPSDHEIESVRCFLMPEFVYGNKLQDRIGVERRDMQVNEATLDRLLGFIDNRKKARIAGCAGAGKTMLAVSKAKQLDASGKAVLFLVYNKALAGYLAEHLVDCTNVKVQHFHQFCFECCGDSWPEDKQLCGDFWWNTAPELLEKALKDSPVQYDALIIDEAQDFKCDAWLVLDRLVKPDGWYYIFYDKVQNIYDGDLEFDVSEDPFLLLSCCRSTKEILASIKERTGIELIGMEDMPDGTPTRVESAGTESQRARMLGKILHDWIKKEGLSENQVVVLGGHSLKNTSVGESGKAGGFKLMERGDPAPGVIPYYTYMAFKGCEADAVILLDVDPTDKRWDKTGLYTSMTRARHLLGIVENKKEVC